MASNTTGTVSIEYNVTQTEQDSSNTSSKVTTFSQPLTFTSGTGSGNINTPHFQSGVLPSGGKVDIDLYNLITVLFGCTGSISFSGGHIKTFSIGNMSTDIFNAFTVAGTGTDGLTGVFNGETGNVQVNPGGTFLWSDCLAGMNILDSNKSIQLIDTAGSGSPYQFLLTGVTGTIAP